MVYEVRDEVALIRINRPDKLSTCMTMMSRSATLVSARRDEGVRAVVVTGTGKGFCSGVDLQALDSLGTAPIARKRMLTEHVYKVVRAVEDLDKPLICAVNGLAVGAGMDMALMCDIRLAATSAR